jgi:predicted transcriptional regulator
MSVESVRPSEQLKKDVRSVLKDEGPLDHSEIVHKISAEDSQVQRAINELWREGRVSHTLDRRFELNE